MHTDPETLIKQRCRPADPRPGPARPEAIKRQEILGGLIHEYHSRVA
jgi:hypothetical protein